jgi:hypothetical protein
MDRAEARKRYEETFRDFMAAYPRRVDHARAYDIFLDLVLDEGVEPSMLISRAASYSSNVDPESIKFVPSPRTWLRDRRFHDEDIFTDRKVSAREWFIRAYTDADAAAVEKKYGYVYPDPPIPDMTQGEIRQWCEDDRRKWVGQIANHVLNNAPLPE